MKTGKSSVVACADDEDDMDDIDDDNDDKINADDVSPPAQDDSAMVCDDRALFVVAVAFCA